MWHWMTDPSGPGLPIWLSGPEQKVSPGQLVFDSRWLVLMTPPGLQQHHNFFYGCMQIFFQHSLWSVIVIRLSRSVGSRFCKAFVQLLWFSSPMYLCIYTPHLVECSLLVSPSSLAMTHFWFVANLNLKTNRMANGSPLFIYLLMPSKEFMTFLAL